MANELTKLAFTSLVVAVGLLGGPARAEATAPEIAAAQDLFTEAREHQANKDWAACEASLQRAVRILETPGLRFNLAFCKEQQHRWVEALVDYRRAGELAEQDEATDVQELLPTAIADLERLTPKLEIVVERAPEGLELFIDGKGVSNSLLGTAFPVDPGGRRIEVTAPGHEPFSVVVNLLPEERRQVRVELSKVEEAAPPQPVRRETRQDVQPQESSGVGAQAVVLAGEALLTIAGLAVGVGYTYEANTRSRDRERLVEEINDISGCAPDADPHPLCPEVREADEEAQIARDRAAIGYAAAGVGAVAFIGTWLLWPDDEDEHALRFSVDADATGATLGLMGSF
jgi:hypothetical protein